MDFPERPDSRNSDHDEAPEVLKTASMMSDASIRLSDASMMSSFTSMKPALSHRRISNSTCQSDTLPEGVLSFHGLRTFGLRKSLFVNTSSRKLRARFSMHSDKSLSLARIFTFGVIYTRNAEIISGIVTVINFVAILVDTDATAASGSAPDWATAVSIACLLYFTFEICCRVFVERTRAFWDAWVWLDLAVVCSGLMNCIVDIAGSSVVPVGPLRLLRCVRLFRIFRAFSLFGNARHLRSIVRSINVCLKILFWSLGIFFLVMTMWATLAVELLRPIMGEVAKHSAAWSDCARCSRSFDSIMAANLTLFQTIIAGDSWGMVAIPVIEDYPWAAFIFVGSLFTISVGLLNIVIAVLVDAASEARDSDMEMRALQARRNELNEKRSLKKLFRLMDSDGNGGLSFEELKDGIEKIPELHQNLKSMDIHDEDLYELFLVLDEDGSGEVDPDEFINALYRLKFGDNKTAALFVKRYVLHMKKNQLDLLHNVVSIQEQVRGMSQHLGNLGSMSVGATLIHPQSLSMDAAHHTSTGLDGLPAVPPQISNGPEYSCGTVAKFADTAMPTVRRFSLDYASATVSSVAEPECLISPGNGEDLHPVTTKPVRLRHEAYSNYHTQLMAAQTLGIADEVREVLQDPYINQSRHGNEADEAINQDLQFEGDATVDVEERLLMLKACGSGPGLLTVPGPADATADAEGVLLIPNSCREGPRRPGIGPASPCSTSLSQSPRPRGLIFDGPDSANQLIKM